MKHKYFSFPVSGLTLVVFLSLNPGHSRAVEAKPNVQEVIISAEKISPLTTGNAMTSTMVVTQDEIEWKQYKTVAEAIASVPGVSLVKSGPGQTVSVFIRGQKSEQTLVLIDGVEFNDPTDPGRGVDLSNLGMDNIERIEVIRGAQSVLYPGVGSVIQIITKGGGSPRSYLELEGGSYGTLRGEVASRGIDAQQLSYAVSAGLARTDGFSAAAGGSERDGSKTVDFSTKLQKKYTQSTTADLSVRYLDGKNDLDLAPEDTGQFRSSTQSWLTRLHGKSRLGLWEPSLSLNLRTIERYSLNFGSTPNTRFYSSGDIAKVDWVNRFFLSEQHVLAVVLETERQHAKMESNYGFGATNTDEAVNQTALLAQYDYVTEKGPFVTAGVRTDYHSTFYWEPTVRVAPGIKIPSLETTLRAAVGTGFKAPSIYQLYGEYGNRSLKAEKALLVDIGIEQSLFEHRVALVATVFYHRLTDMVDFDIPNNRFITVGKALNKGVEVTAEVSFVSAVKFTSSYTYLHTKDEITGFELLRRPNHRLTNSLLYSAGDWQGVVTHQLVGQRTDVDVRSFARKSMPTYNLFSLGLNWQCLKQTKLNMRVENLLNERYQAIDGYNTAALSVYAGIRQEL